MKQQQSKHYTGKLFKMAGSSKVKALGKQSNKGSRFTHWVVKTKRVFELPLKGLDSEKQEVQTPASSQTSGEFLHLSPDILSLSSRSLSPEHFLPILFTSKISPALQADVQTERSCARQLICTRQKGNGKATTSLRGKTKPQVSSQGAF